MKIIKLCISVLSILIVINSYSQECTKLGTYIGTFHPSFMPYIDAEDPKILRTILWDNHISNIASNTTAMNNLLSFMDTLENREIEAIMTIRFPYSDSLNKDDRIIYDSTELNNFISDLEYVLNAVDGKLDYLQVLNENLGNGRYTITIDSLMNNAGLSQNQAHEMVLNWMDTISYRFRKIIDYHDLNVSLLSPSVLPLGIQSVIDNEINSWAYKVTVKVHQLANQYCDLLNYHWYPTSLEKMQELMSFSDTSSVLHVNQNVGRSCTEWSQAHEVRDILSENSAFWTNELNMHCGTTDSTLTPEYLNLINDSLGVNHSHTYDMYQLMNAREYEFAVYYAMIQNSYICGEADLVYYALASLYATRFTANKVPNGLFYKEYQNINEYITNNCQPLSVHKNISSDLPIVIFPNPAEDKLIVDFSKFEKSRVKLNIFNLSGQLVYAQNIYNTTGQSKIDISNLGAGTYFAHIISDEQQLYCRKLIITK